MFVDKVLVGQAGSANPHLVAQARANPFENFRLVFADIFGRILDDPTFQAVVMDHYLQRVFEQARLTSVDGPQ
ncbi:MAG TPA: hypothetical protein VIK31_13370 [Propionibacteriaceae bacterium]|jgi:hypothetical protein